MVLTFPHGQEDDLSSFQVNMLSANRIPRLLEMQVEAKDGQMRLHYKITGKKMLAHWLRMERLTLREYYKLLLRIVEVMDDSKIYMLQPGRYVLEEEYIYCGSGMHDMYFTYVPKDNLEGKHTVSSDFQRLASKWIHRVTELHGRGFQELMRYLQEEAFNLPELKQLLHNQLNLLQDSPVVSNGVPKSLEPPEKPSTADQKFMEEQQVWQESGVRHHRVQPFSPLLTTEEESEVQGPAVDHRKKQLWIILLIMLAWSFIWKLYADHPQDSMLLVSTGLTLLIGAMGFVLLRNIRKAAEADTEEDPPVEDWVPSYDANNDGGFFARIGLAESGAHREPARADIPVAEPFSSQSQPSNLAMRTTLLSPPDATVFIGRLVPKTKREEPFLEFLKEGSREQASICKSGFVIGRAAEEVDLFHEEPGVSRLHAEIMKQPEGYGIRDLGSRNGTALNGETLVPYQVQPLKEGDIVKIVRTEFKFIMGS
nr:MULTISPECIES: DUF6382 domain-containing protein [unclassified Paenibacillus]